MSWIDAFAPVEAIYREEVMRATWGHLAPKKGKIYRGYMTFAIGCYDHDDLNPTPLKVQFRGLDDSPWIYEAIHERLSRWHLGFGRRRRRQPRFAVGGVYRFDGCIQNYRFYGKIRRIL
jgi:hypothetical protein